MNMTLIPLLWETAKILNDAASMEEALSGILEKTVRILNCEEAAVWLLNIKDSRVYIAAHVGKEDVSGSSVDLDQNIIGKVLRFGIPELIPDCSQDLRFAAIKETGQLTTRNLLCVPLKSQYECIGCLNLLNKAEGFTQDDVEDSLLLSSLIATGLNERGFSVVPAETKKTLVSLRNVTKGSLVKDISLNIYEKELLAITGEDGCGKETLMRLIGGLDVPDQGKIVSAGKEIAVLSEEELELYRRDFAGYILGESKLLDHLTVRDNIRFVSALSLDPINTDKAMNLVGLNGLGKKYPDQLTPGQRQLTAVARAFAKHPVLVIAEEPVGQLRAEEARPVLMAIRQAMEATGATVILVTHNLEIAKIADRIIKMRDGQIFSVRANHFPAAPEDLVW